SVVSVGAPGAERQITNVAAGQISATSTDAINGSQLFATNTALGSLNNTVTSINNGGGIKYFHANSTLADSNPVGTNSVAIGPVSTATGANSVSLGNGATATNAGDVALGSGSMTATANPTPNVLLDGTIYNFAGSAPTSVVSVGAPGAERQITNVAAGQISATSTDAINGSQLFATNTALGSLNNTVTNINNGGGIKYFHANSTLADSSATGPNSVAIGPASTATAANAISIGNGASASTANSVALGSGSATGTVTGTPSTVIAGTTYAFAGTAPIGTISVGTAGNERTITNVAAGQISATSTDAINGSQLFAADTAITAVANQVTTVTGQLTHYYSVNDGGTQQANYANNGATGADSLAAGVAASATATNASALGFNAQSTVADGVALGSNSVSNRALAPASGTIGGTFIPYNTADRALLGAISVGSATTYRQITNVADGTQPSDAVTIRQLIGSLSSFATTTTKYFHANSTAPDSLAVGTDSIAVGPNTVVNGNNGVGIGNGALVQQNAPGGVAIGQNATVNFQDSLALGTNATASGIQSVSIGAGATTANPTSVALGAGAKATANAGDVALGANSKTSAAVGTTSASFANFTLSGFAGTNPTSTVSVGDVGSERTITNVAAGRITSTSTDAINGSQLFALANVVDNNYNSISGAINGGGIKYFHTNSSAVDSAATGAESVAVGPQSTASASNAIAMGNGAGASAANSVAIGAGAKATQANSLALGANSTTTANLSDAAYTPVVGATTAGVATGEVSVGSAGAERRITNVAAGSAATDAVNVSQLQSLANVAVKYDTDGAGNITNRVTLSGGNPNAPVTIGNVAPGVNGTDAVNVNQLNQAFNQLNSSIGSAQKDAWRGAAIGMAAASLRYDDRPGKWSSAIGSGVWHGEGALSFGVGYTSEDGRVRINASGTTSGGRWGAGAGLSLTLN
ncbi:calcium-binding protein, partial [Methylovirgula sp. 4M-Z18]